jgi:hypothetical protein
MAAIRAFFIVNSFVRAFARMLVDSAGRLPGWPETVPARPQVARAAR